MTSAPVWVNTQQVKPTTVPVQRSSLMVNAKSDLKQHPTPLKTKKQEDPYKSKQCQVATVSVKDTKKL